MLSLGDAGRSHAEALVAQARWGDANAVEVTRGKTRGASKGDKKTVDVGAFAAKRGAREHRADVTRAAATCSANALRICDKPGVDRARLLNVAACARNYSIGGFFDAAVGWDKRGRLGEERALFARERRDLSDARVDVHCAVARQHAAHNLFPTFAPTG